MGTGIRDAGVIGQMPSRDAQIAEWKQLTEQVLPALAKQNHWPLQLDHCFKRVCLDFAFKDVWYRHVRKPAERHIDGDAVERALQCARDIAQQGEPLLRVRNDESLRYRRRGRHAKSCEGGLDK